jgi:ornithine carbamoyltransferase
VLHTPPGYGLAPEIVAGVAELSRQHGGTVTEHHAPPEGQGAFDVLYATRWQTTGTEKADPDWRRRFAPFKIDQAMFERFGRDGAVFMHDLPAVRDEDCEAALLDGASSIAFEQAQQKLFTAMAILEWCSA